MRTGLIDVIFFLSSSSSRRLADFELINEAIKQYYPKYQPQVYWIRTLLKRCKLWWRLWAELLTAKITVIPRRSLISTPPPTPLERPRTRHYRTRVAPLPRVTTTSQNGTGSQGHREFPENNFPGNGGGGGERRKSRRRPRTLLRSLFCCCYKTASGPYRTHY